MSEELKRYRKLAKQKEYELRMKEIKTKNERILKLRTRNPKEYWKILKKITGINIHKTLPDELLWDGISVKGERTLEVWEEAFRKLSFF